MRVFSRSLLAGLLVVLPSEATIADEHEVYIRGRRVIVERPSDLPPPTRDPIEIVEVALSTATLGIRDFAIDYATRVTLARLEGRSPRPYERIYIARQQLHWVVRVSGTMWSPIVNGPGVASSAAWELWVCDSAGIVFGWADRHGGQAVDPDAVTECAAQRGFAADDPQRGPTGPW